MTRQRCLVCGVFYEGDECPNLLAGLHGGPPEPILEPAVLSWRLGQFVRYPWQGSGEPVICMVVSLDPDGPGTLGLMVMNENVRVSVDDVWRIQ